MPIFSKFSDTANVGAVASLRRVKRAVSVARAVLDHTHHSILAGELATKFAVKMGFKEEPLETEESTTKWKEWRGKQCQPNFWTVRGISRQVCLCSLFNEMSFAF
jgi:N4-(beta-N-acetylglucosaminyl)-L-asparaginase